MAYLSETPSRGMVTYHIEYIENVVHADDSSSSGSCCYIVCCGRGKKKKRWRRCAAPPASRSPVTPWNRIILSLPCWITSSLSTILSRHYLNSFQNTRLIISLTFNIYIYIFIWRRYRVKLIEIDQIIIIFQLIWRSTTISV